MAKFNREKIESFIPSSIKSNIGGIVIRKAYARYDGRGLLRYEGLPKHPDQKAFRFPILLSKKDEEHMNQLKLLNQFCVKSIMHVFGINPKDEEDMKDEVERLRVPFYDCRKLPANFEKAPDQVKDYWIITNKSKAFEDSPDAIENVRPRVYDHRGNSIDSIIPAGSCVTVRLGYYFTEVGGFGISFVPKSVVWHKDIPSIDIPAGSGSSINPEAERQAMAEFFSEGSEEDIYADLLS